MAVNPVYHQTNSSLQQELDWILEAKKDPERFGPSGGRIPPIVSISAFSTKLKYQKNERTIQLLPDRLPNRDRPGAGQIPAPATIFHLFLKRFGC